MRRDHIPERGHIETHVARFEHMGQRTPLRFAREQRQKRGEILRLKLLRPRELPQDRPELVAQRRDRALHEARDRFARFGQHFAVHRVTRRALSEKTKLSGVSPAHFSKLARASVR